MCKVYDDLPYVVKIILQIFFGWILGGIYRILKYVEKKNTTTLIVGILFVIPGIDLIPWVIDLVTVILHNKITIFAD